MESGVHSFGGFCHVNYPEFILIRETNIPPELRRGTIPPAKVL